MATCWIYFVQCDEGKNIRDNDNDYYYYENYEDDEYFVVVDLCSSHDDVDEDSVADVDAADVGFDAVVVVDVGY